jgi:hypothetical protein
MGGLMEADLEETEILAGLQDSKITKSKLGRAQGIPS